MPVFSENGEILAHHKRKVCQMKDQAKRNSLSIYLGIGVSGKSPKILLEFKNISGSEKLRYSYNKKVCSRKCRTFFFNCYIHHYGDKSNYFLLLEQV